MSALRNKALKAAKKVSRWPEWKRGGSAAAAKDTDRLAQIRRNHDCCAAYGPCDICWLLSLTSRSAG